VEVPVKIRKLWESEHFISPGQDTAEYFYAIKPEETYGLDVYGVKVWGPMNSHAHPHIEQIYYIRSGKGIMNIDGEEAEVVQDDIIYVPVGKKHFIRPAEGETNLTYLFFSHYHKLSSVTQKLGEGPHTA
jgi:mannose-6-phosphate isomerase-like protein (cupin superfamily)